MLETVGSKQHNARVNIVYGETPISIPEHHFGLHSRNNLTAGKRSDKKYFCKIYVLL